MSYGAINDRSIDRVSRTGPRLPNTKLTQQPLDGCQHGGLEQGRCAFFGQPFHGLAHGIGLGVLLLRDLGLGRLDASILGVDRFAQSILQLLYPPLVHLRAFAAGFDALVELANLFPFGSPLVGGFGLGIPKFGVGIDQGLFIDLTEPVDDGIGQGGDEGVDRPNGEVANVLAELVEGVAQLVEFTDQGIDIEGLGYLAIRALLILEGGVVYLLLLAVAADGAVRLKELVVQLQD